MQIMDLTKLRASYGKASSHVQQLQQDALYDGVTSTHNVVINEQTGFAYLVGSQTCRGGLHVVDINDRPDSRYQDREICFGYNEDTLTIVDVSDKANMKMLARVSYDNAFYTHQGFLTADMKYLMLNDELDEQLSGNQHTRTMMWTVEDLENPQLLGSHYAEDKAIDHNLY